MYGHHCLQLNPLATDDDGSCTYPRGLRLQRQCVFDADGDGTCDEDDGCPFDPNKTDPGVCGCGVFDLDTDNDGYYDCEEDCDFDAAENRAGHLRLRGTRHHTDGDGMPDCFDLCPYDSDKIFPGVCGCGVSDVDTDGDGVADCNDVCPNDPTTTQANVAAQTNRRYVRCCWMVVRMIPTRRSPAFAGVA